MFEKNKKIKKRPKAVADGKAAAGPCRLKSWPGAIALIGAIASQSKKKGKKVG